MRLTLVIISSFFLLSGCSLWSKYVSKKGVDESSQISEQAAVNSSAGLNSVDRGLSGIGEPKQETTIIQQNPIRPGKNEILIKYRNKSSEVILSLDPRDNNVQIDVSKAQGLGDMFSESSIPLNSPQYSDGSKPSSRKGDSNSSDQEHSERDMLAQAQNSFYSGDYQRALQQVNNSIDIRQSAEAYALKGSIYYMLGDLGNARKNWLNSLRINNNIQGVRQMLNIIGN